VPLTVFALGEVSRSPNNCFRTYTTSARTGLVAPVAKRQKGLWQKQVRIPHAVILSGAKDLFRSLLTAKNILRGIHPERARMTIFLTLVFA
jgi:hypothetical protein